jgi:hypothetical protein
MAFNRALDVKQRIDPPDRFKGDRRDFLGRFPLKDVYMGIRNS